MRQTNPLAGIAFLLLATSACGLNDSLLLNTTIGAAGAGTAYPVARGGTTAATTATIAETPVATTPSSELPMRASPFCKLLWGRSWSGTDDELTAAGEAPYPDNLGMMTIWIGYEDDDSVDEAIAGMLRALGPDGPAKFQGVVPVLYAYFIPFKASNRDDLGPCDPTAKTANLCTEGAAWIRKHRDYMRRVYDGYARRIAEIWGTTRPLVWLFEPGFSNYARDSQTAPLSVEELSVVASDLISTVKARLPNALVSHHASPLTTDMASYFGAFDLSQISLVNVTGAATSDRPAPADGEKQTSTYRELHDATGLPILVDTGFRASHVENHGWLSSTPDVINARIADGVVAVEIDPAPDDMQAQIDRLNPALSGLNCKSIEIQ